MAQFRTDTQTMQAASQHVDQVNAQVASLLASLRAEVATAPSHFKGDAARTFAKLMADYDRDAKALGDALRGISEQILASGKAYSAQDAEQAARIQQAGSGLNM